MSQIIVKVNHATKSFRETVALKDISVDFEKGKIHGIIGRNGSGKSVLFKCICGFMSLDHGEIWVNNCPVKSSVPQDIGIIIEDPGFIDTSSGFQNLKLLSLIRGKINNQQIRNAMDRVGLDPNSRKRVKHYSLGMRHRLGIAQAIMENPPLLILDEPMNGLDKQGVQEMRLLFSELKDRGVTIILSSHYDEDIQMLCDTVSRMDAGVLVPIIQ